MPSLAQLERRALCDTLESHGPDAPTLCEGWNSQDLAAHLVVREGRPDAALGIGIKPLAGYTAKVMRDATARPWAQVIHTIRTGPPRWSLFSLPGVDSLVNLGEFFVHHEDLLRASDASARRTLAPGVEQALWTTLTRLGRLSLRKSPVGVQVVANGFGEAELRRAKAGATISLNGRPSELLLHLFGRDSSDAALVDVEVDGSPADVEAYAAAATGL